MPTNTFDLPILPLSKFKFDFIPDGAIRLPAYPGSAWRGAFGNALKKSVCVVKNTPCADCMLKTSCAYPYIFETPCPQGAEKMRKYDAVPHPFVIEPPLNLDRDPAVYTLGLTVFGKGQRFFPYMLNAFERAGQHGIGGIRQPFILQQVRCETTGSCQAVIYAEGKLHTLPPQYLVEYPEIPEVIEISLNTPLRIKRHGRNINRISFEFAAFFSSLLRRISMLTYFHTDTPLQTNFAGLTRQAEGVELRQPRLHWYDWTRYSSRQQTEMSMGGLLGNFKLLGAEIEPFWPYLWLGQWTYAGKGTSMGMGAYSIKSASL